jgi:hypothetical protein
VLGFSATILLVFWDRELIEEFAREYWPTRIVSRVALQALRGGLESSGVARAVAHDSAGRQVGSFVVKLVGREQVREIGLLRKIESLETATRVTPRLLEFRKDHAFIEWVRSPKRWPWREPALALSVMDQLAVVHSWPTPDLIPALSGWDYEAELRHSAAATEEAYSRLAARAIRPGGRPMSPALRRLVEKMPVLRAQLLDFFGTAVLHGDVHPGNVVVRATGSGREVLLLDWGRARLGSPLEDLSSWVSSVGLWEPEARRVHDTLLRRYLASRDSAQQLSQQFRDACCLAGACNALSGALRYHLAVLADERRNRREQRASDRAAADWLRIVRRADLSMRR